MAESNITIRFAVRDDVDRVMQAIKKHWDANHIMGSNKDFFLYIFAENNEKIRMVIAEELNTGEIAGFLGYIKYSADDPCDIALVFWKAVDGKEAFLGIKLMLFLLKRIKPALIFSIGVNPDTALPIYKKLKYHTGKVEHYYRLSDRTEYKIAQIADKRILPVMDSDWNILPLLNFTEFNTKIDNTLLKEMRPYKDKNYFSYRFFEHPIYRYKIYGITRKGTDTIPAFFVCREAEKFGVKILRIIDYIGKEEYFGYIAAPIQNLIGENNYEYIDCYCCGMSEQTMNKAGLVLRTENDKNIIPNYFEPFLCKNGDVYYFTSNTENFRAFRGDADQDQPRLFDRTLC